MTDERRGKVATWLAVMVGIIVLAFTAWAVGDAALYEYLAPLTMVVIIGVTAMLTLKP